MNGIYCDEAIKKEFETVFGGKNINIEHNIYVLYAEKPEFIEKNSIIIVNGDNRRLLKSLAGTAETVITCGMSRVSTFTFSSMNDGGYVLCLQRAVVSFDGKIMQPQEIPVSIIGEFFDPDKIMLILVFAFLARQSMGKLRWQELLQEGFDGTEEQN